jgi:hypothetical protein
MTMRIAILLVLFALPAAGAQPEAAPAPQDCVMQGNGERMEFRCELPGAATQFHFIARFSGGHDDTMASMTVTVGDQPLQCDEGSKTQLMGEYGDVALECRFSVARVAGAAPQLKVVVKWGHAQYEGFELRPQAH